MLWSLLGSDRCMTMHWLGWSREAINSSVMIILLTWDKDGMRIGLCGDGSQRLTNAWTAVVSSSKRSASTGWG